MLSTDNFVMNPGNFGKNSEFIIIYPNSNNCKVILNELPEWVYFYIFINTIFLVKYTIKSFYIIYILQRIY